MFTGKGTLSIANGAIRVVGRRIPSEDARLAPGFAWFFGLLLLAAYSLTLAYPEGISGFTGLSIPIVAFACVAANFFHWVHEDFELPLSAIRTIARDEKRNLLALTLSGPSKVSPIVIRVERSDTIEKALREMKSFANSESTSKA